MSNEGINFLYDGWSKTTKDFILISYISMDPIIATLFQFAVLIFSVIVHEVSHGLMALKLGDETAKREGRLTMNPIPHLDPIGSFILPLILYISGSPIMLGWAKPVPYNPLALFKDFKYGPLKVALSGPLSNLAIAIVFGFILRFGGGLLPMTMVPLIQIIVLINSLLFVFNMLPIPPLDGSKILTTFLPFEYARRLENMGLMGIMWVFLFLMLFPGFIQGLAIMVADFILGPYSFMAR